MSTYIGFARWTPVLGGVALLSLAGSMAFRATRGPCPECVLTQAAKLAATADPNDPFARFGPDAKKMEFLVRTKGGRVQKLAACFAPDTPPEKMAEFLKHMRMQSQGSWPTHQTGGIQPSYYTSGFWPYNPSTKRYPVMVSYVPDGTMINGYVGEAPSPSTYTATTTSQFGGTPPTVQPYEYWGGVDTYPPRFSRLYISNPAGGNGFTVDDGANFDTADGAASVRGDVRIGMHPIDGPGGLLGYAFFPGPGVGGNIVLDSSENWAQGGAPGYKFWWNVRNHEFGHALGLEHVCPIDGTKLMEPVVSLTLAGAQHDDVRGLQSLYGDITEPNETLYEFYEYAGYYTLPGYGDAWSYAGVNLVDGQPLVSQYSLRDSYDNDYMPLSWIGLSIPARVDLVVFPVGKTYADNPQNADGTCATGHTTNSLALADIAVEIWNMYGERIATVNDHGPGEAESFTELYLPNNASYTIHVYSVNSFTGPQMYAFKARRYFDVPVITTLSPTNIGAGSSSFPLTVTYSNPPQSARGVVYWNGSPRPTTTTSNGYIATISAADVASVGTATVQLYNPEIGGGMSNPLTFNITTAPATVTPESFQLVRGRTNGPAVLSQLFYSDDNRMGLKPGFVLSSSEAPVDINLTATSPFASPSQISFKLESRAGTSNIRQTVYLYNYTSGGWESADVRQTPTSDTSITITPPSAAVNYVSPINRQIKARMTYKASGAVLYYPWDIDIDQGIWNIAP